MNKKFFMTLLLCAVISQAAFASDAADASSAAGSGLLPVSPSSRGGSAGSGAAHALNVVPAAAATAATAARAGAGGGGAVGDLTPVYVDNDNAVWVPRDGVMTKTVHRVVQASDAGAPSDVLASRSPRRASSSSDDSAAAASAAPASGGLVRTLATRSTYSVARRVLPVAYHGTWTSTAVDVVALAALGYVVATDKGGTRSALVQTGKDVVGLAKSNPKAVAAVAGTAALAGAVAHDVVASKRHA